MSATLPVYEVSDWGRIRRIPHEVAMPNGGTRVYGGKPWRGCDGGEGRLTFQYRGKTYKVHRLVCEAFNGPPPFEGAVCMHLDEDYRNNRPENLAWGTQKENLNAPGCRAKFRGRVGDKSPGAIGRARRAAKAAAVAALIAAPAAGQTMLPINCATASSAVNEMSHLNRVYGEDPVFAGITDGDEPSVMVLMASPSGSYSLLLILPTGRACYLITGQEIAPPTLPGDRG